MTGLGGSTPRSAHPSAPTRSWTSAHSAANLDRYAEAGVEGLLTLGSNGENRSLDEDERLAVLEIVVRHRGDGQLVLAGATYDAQRRPRRFLVAAATSVPTSVSCWRPATSAGR